MLVRTRARSSENRMPSIPRFVAKACAGAAAPTCALLAVGFTPAGPAAGSLAAAWQATMGGAVASGSAFAILQSAAMGGSAAAMALVSALSSAGAAIVF